MTARVPDHDRIRNLQDEVTRLRDLVTELVGALRFYADRDHYRWDNERPSVVEEDRGERARKALL